ncbi:hypothetical protein GGX14DRAFT_391365 [Mycena pura]|uniref:Uncharacterized protein n=1 Tax=Mycena pura TaxID=153505 RepID=A0AAD6YIN9_9AGAR|nr:hypothetical protein GGX14DRAFT_391365 [Mycena pura]
MDIGQTVRGKITPTQKEKAKHRGGKKLGLWGPSRPLTTSISLQPQRRSWVFPSVVPARSEVPQRSWKARREGRLMWNEGARIRLQLYLRLAVELSCFARSIMRERFAERSSPQGWFASPPNVLLEAQGCAVHILEETEWFATNQRSRLLCTNPTWDRRASGRVDKVVVDRNAGVVAERRESVRAILKTGEDMLKYISKSLHQGRVEMNRPLAPCILPEPTSHSRPVSKRLAERSHPQGKERVRIQRSGDNAAQQWAARTEPNPGHARHNWSGTAQYHWNAGKNRAVRLSRAGQSGRPPAQESPHARAPERPGMACRGAQLRVNRYAANDAAVLPWLGNLDIGRLDTPLLLRIVPFTAPPISSKRRVAGAHILREWFAASQRSRPSRSARAMVFPSKFVERRHKATRARQGKGRAAGSENSGGGTLLQQARTSDEGVARGRRLLILHVFGTRDSARRCTLLNTYTWGVDEEIGGRTEAIARRAYRPPGVIKEVTGWRAAKGSRKSTERRRVTRLRSQQCASARAALASVRNGSPSAHVQGMPETDRRALASRGWFAISGAHVSAIVLVLVFVSAAVLRKVQHQRFRTGQPQAHRPHREYILRATFAATLRIYARCCVVATLATAEQDMELVRQKWIAAVGLSAPQALTTRDREEGIIEVLRSNSYARYTMYHLQTPNTTILTLVFFAPLNFPVFKSQNQDHAVHVDTRNGSPSAHIPHGIDHAQMLFGWLGTTACASNRRADPAGHHSAPEHIPSKLRAILIPPHPQLPGANGNDDAPRSCTQDDIPTSELRDADAARPLHWSAAGVSPAREYALRATFAATLLLRGHARSRRLEELSCVPAFETCRFRLPPGACIPRDGLLRSRLQAIAVSHRRITVHEYVLRAALAATTPGDGDDRGPIHGRRWGAVGRCGRDALWAAVKTTILWNTSTETGRRVLASARDGSLHPGAHASGIMLLNAHACRILLCPPGNRCTAECNISISIEST